MVGGCFTWFGLEPLVLALFFISALVHKARVIALWFEDNRVFVMTRPAQTLLLNYLDPKAPLPYTFLHLINKIPAFSVNPLLHQNLRFIFLNFPQCFFFLIPSNILPIHTFRSYSFLSNFFSTFPEHLNVFRPTLISEFHTLLLLILNIFLR